MATSDTITGGRVLGGIKPAAGWPSACYGVDIQGDDAVVVLAEKRRGRVIWHPLAPDAMERAEWLAGAAAMSACLTARESLTRRLEAPFASLRKARRVLPTLLDIQVPFAVEDCHYAFLDPGRSESGTLQTLAVAATREHLQRALARLGGHGIDPVYMDVEGLAAWSQALHEAPPAVGDDDRLRVVLILAGDRSSLTLGRGRRFVNSYGLRADDSARVARIVRAQQRDDGDRPAWIVAGADVAGAQVPASLRQQLAIPDTDDFNVVTEPNLFLARALAIRPLVDGPLRCNLRQGTDAHPQLVRQGLRHHVVSASICIAAGLVLCAANFAVQRLAAARRTAITATVRGRVDAIAGYPVAARGPDAMTIVDGVMQRRRETLEPFRRSFDPSLADTLVAIAQEAQRRDLHVETLELGVQKAALSGWGRSWDASKGIADVLTAAGYAVTLSRGEAQADERIPFSVSTGGRP